MYVLIVFLCSLRGSSVYYRSIVINGFCVALWSLSWGRDRWFFGLSHGIVVILAFPIHLHCYFIY